MFIGFEGSDAQARWLITYGRAFLVDPLGNVMMTYAPDPAPKDVQTDLKRLLKNSEPWMKR